MGLSSLTSSWEGVNPEKPSNPFILACFDLLLCSPWSQLLLLNHNGHLDMLQPLMLPILLHTLPQLPTPTLMLLVSHMVFTILANVKLKLTLNTSTTQEFTAMDIMDIFQRSTTLLPLQLFTTMLTTEYITMDTTDTFQRSITLLLLRSSTIMPTTVYTTAFTTEYTVDFTIPTLVSTILVSVKLKLILNGYLIMDILHTPAILDTLD